MSRWEDIPTEPAIIEFSYEDGEILDTDGNPLHPDILSGILSFFGFYNELNPNFDPEQELKSIEIVIHSLSSGVANKSTYHSPDEYDEDRELDYIDIKCSNRLFTICNPRAPTYNDSRFINTKECWEIAEKIFDTYYDEVMSTPLMQYR